MTITPTPLPNDIEALKELLANRDALVAKLLAEIARLKRWQFGRSSERLDATLVQLQLALDDLQSAPPPTADTPAVAPVPAEDSTHTPPQKRVLPLRRAPRAFPAHLPRETVVHAPTSCSCPDCGGAMRELGEDVSEMLDMVPGYFKVIRHVRPKLACGHCSRIVQRPAPSRPIARGMAAPGLLAQIIVAKYADHCPLYRQQGIYRRSGVELDRATLAAWVGETARLLEPLVNVLGRYVLAAEKVHADDTPVPVLDPGRGKTKTGRLWTYVRDDRPAASRDPPAVWYRYSPNRKGEHPQTHLRHFRGILQADAYAGFGPLYADGQIVEAACWAHARRKFYDLYMVDRSPIAAEAMQRIGALYAIERDIRGTLPAQRARVRQERAGPLLEALHAWLAAMLSLVSAKSELAGAIKYALVRWTALTRYRHDGRIEIDNNSAERSIRPLVLGRRNYLFAGSDSGGERAANIYSLIGTALLNGRDPYLYLRHVLERIAEHPSNRVDQLLPWHVVLEEPAERQRA
ncbi:MAG TPA: IS66 family transposase [Rhizobiales bacterium]|nr:IS66 family transposase [Hyphomicrobiales bacterium]